MDTINWLIDWFIFIGHLYSFEMGAQITYTLSFFSAFLNPLYPLDSNPLSDEGLARFPPRAGSLCTLWTVSLALQKLFNLTRFHLSILAFRSWAVGVLVRKLFTVPTSWKATPVFFQQFQSVRSYMKVFDPFWVYFCTGREVESSKEKKLCTSHHQAHLCQFGSFLLSEGFHSSVTGFPADSGSWLLSCLASYMCWTLNPAEDLPPVSS